jgi:regulator of replication initiation timing
VPKCGTGTQKKMPEIISSITAAITTAKKMKEISDKIKNAELRNLVGDLSLELAEIKTQLAEVSDENRQLKLKVRELESAEGEPCPKCFKRGWHVESSQRDPMFGDLGGIRRIYKCSVCGFSESTLITPK